MPPRSNPTCQHCGRSFEPDRFNRYHQKYCGLPACTAARNCGPRQKNRHKQQLEDPSFQERERVRCREAMRRLRARRKAAEARAAPADAPPAPAAAEPPDISALIIQGMISQVIDSLDSEEVRRATMAYADRGRRLAVGGPCGGNRSG